MQPKVCIMQLLPVAEASDEHTQHTTD